MRWLTAWIRATFDYNPTFPLSALALLTGLRLLARDGTLDTESAAGATGGLAVLQAWQLLLLGTSLLVLWPRRIAYETTSALIILAVVRYAAPFVVASYAADAGEPGLAALLGLATAALGALQARAAQGRLGLDLRGWERAYDAALYGLCCVAFPLLACGLAEATGGGLSFEAARLAQLLAWWALALVLVPLATGLPDLGAAARPLGSRRPAAVWRDLAVVATPLLLGSALWLAGDGPLPVALLPVGVVAGAVLAQHARAAGLDPSRWAAKLPAAAAAVAVFGPEAWLLGRTPCLGRGAVLATLLPAAAAAVPLCAPGPAAVKEGLRHVGAVAALAPLAVAPGWREAEAYLLLLSVAAAAVGLARREDRLVALAWLAATLLGAHLLGVRALGGPPAALLLASATLAAAVAWRRPGDGETSAALAVGLATLGAAGALLGGRPPAAPALVAGLLDGAALGLLAWRQGRPGVGAAAAGVVLAVTGRRIAAGVDPGLLLVALGFVGVPAGVLVALRRERSAAGAEGPAAEAELEARAERALAA